MVNGPCTVDEGNIHDVAMRDKSGHSWNLEAGRGVRSDGRNRYDGCFPVEEQSQ